MAVKKTTTKTTTKTKKTAEKPVEKVVLEALKKKTAQKETVEEKKTAAENCAEEPSWGTNLYIQSVLGGTISIDEVLARVHAEAPDAKEVYIKPEENKAYWVAESSRGYVVLWD